MADLPAATGPMGGVNPATDAVTLPAAWAGTYTGPATVAGYDRTQLHPGIVHLGVGGFHRSHQATYLNRLNTRAGDETG